MCLWSIISKSQSFKLFCCHLCRTALILCRTVHIECRTAHIWKFWPLIDEQCRTAHFLYRTVHPLCRTAHFWVKSEILNSASAGTVWKFGFSCDFCKLHVNYLFFSLLSSALINLNVYLFVFSNKIVFYKIPQMFSKDRFFLIGRTGCLKTLPRS